LGQEWGLSEGLVRVELRRRVFVHKLITPGLLHLWAVGCPQGLSQHLQALQDGQCLLR